MITKFGFGKSLGLYAPRNDDGSDSMSGGKLAVSDSVAQRVDEEIKVSCHSKLYYYTYVYC